MSENLRPDLPDNSDKPDNRPILRPEELQPPDNSSRKPLNPQEAYNMFTDTVTGANLRWRDNLYQGLAILATIGVGALVGWLAVDDQPFGVLAGAFAGMVLGVIGSGTVLGAYRGLRHARGKHD